MEGKVRILVFYKRICFFGNVFFILGIIVAGLVILWYVFYSVGIMGKEGGFVDFNQFKMVYLTILRTVKIGESSSFQTQQECMKVNWKLECVDDLKISECFFQVGIKVLKIMLVKARVIEVLFFLVMVGSACFIIIRGVFNIEEQRFI